MSPTTIGELSRKTYARIKDWRNSQGEFFQWLCNRSLNGVKSVVGDKRSGMLEAVGEVFPKAKYPALHRPLLQQHVPEQRV